MHAAARLTISALLILALGGIGCESSSTETTAPSIPPAPPKEPAVITAAPEAKPTTATPPTKEESASASAGEVKLQKLTFADLEEKVLKNPKAKYTIMDAWATWCGPCKENFPHVVAMNEKFGGKGLAVVSLALDDPKKPKDVAAAEQFLREKKATFTNVLLDEDFDSGVGFEKLKVNSIPAVFVYGPDGKEVKRFTGDDPNKPLSYDEVEKYVAGLLDGKAPGQ